MNFKKKTKLVLAIILNLFLVHVYAQNPSPSKTWTLEECIDYALKNNLSIQQSQLNAESAKINYVQSQANVLPSLNANGGHSYNIGRTIDRFTNQFADQQVLSQNFGVSTDITLFNGLQNINTINHNKYTIIACELDLEKVKIYYCLNITICFFEIY